MAASPKRKASRVTSLRTAVAPVFLARLRDVTGPAQRLKVVGVPRIAASVDWRHMVALKPPWPAARPAPVSVAVEHLPAHVLPSLVR